MIIVYLQNARQIFAEQTDPVIGCHRLPSVSRDHIHTAKKKDDVFSAGQLRMPPCDLAAI